VKIDVLKNVNNNFGLLKNFRKRGEKEGVEEEQETTTNGETSCAQK
jgi:hypothetical protein